MSRMWIESEESENLRPKAHFRTGSPFLPVGNGPWIGADPFGDLALQETEVESSLLYVFSQRLVVRRVVCWARFWTVQTQVAKRQRRGVRAGIAGAASASAAAVHYR